MYMAITEMEGIMKYKKRLTRRVSPNKECLFYFSEFLKSRRFPDINAHPSKNG